LIAYNPGYNLGCIHRERTGFKIMQKGLKTQSIWLSHPIYSWIYVFPQNTAGKRRDFPDESGPAPHTNRDKAGYA
jgi:hypothetical protein